MEGLKTQETDKFMRFFALIQEEAKKKDSVFFADAGDGNDFETPELECENMMGWLIPSDKVEKFKRVWETNEVDDSWTDFFVWAVWSVRGKTVSIRFEE